MPVQMDSIRDPALRARMCAHGVTHQSSSGWFRALYLPPALQRRLVPQLEQELERRHIHFSLTAHEPVGNKDGVQDVDLFFRFTLSIYVVANFGGTPERRGLDARKTPGNPDMRRNVAARCDAHHLRSW